MKKLYSVLLLSFICAAAHSQKLFEKSMLTAEEQLLCQRFQALKGQERFDVFMKLDHLFPKGTASGTNDPSEINVSRDSTEMLFTTATLFSILGEPDEVRQDGKTLDYNLSSPYCEVTFFIEDDNLISFHGFSNCDKLK